MEDCKRCQEILSQIESEPTNQRLRSNFSHHLQDIHPVSQEAKVQIYGADEKDDEDSEIDSNPEWLENPILIRGGNVRDYIPPVNNDSGDDEVEEIPELLDPENDVKLVIEMFERKRRNGGIPEEDSAYDFCSEFWYTSQNRYVINRIIETYNLSLARIYAGEPNYRVNKSLSEGKDVEIPLFEREERRPQINGIGN